MEPILNVSICLILITFNRSKNIDQLLSRISKYNWIYNEFIIVNNASTDDTVKVINKYKNDLSIELLNLNSNIGHGAGISIALEYIDDFELRPKYVVFLEDDSLPKENFLERLLSSILNSEYDIVSSSGLQVRIGKRIKINPQAEKIYDANFILFDGAIALFSSLKIVGFPLKDWFMMVDDFEYCYRLRKHGVKLGVIKNDFLIIFHEGFGDGSTHSSFWRAYYQSRNYIHFVKMHFSLFTLFDFVIIQTKRMVGELFIKNGFTLFKFRVKGLLAGLNGRKGKSLDPLSLQDLKF